MAYDPGAIDATLTAAVGEQPDLIAELRQDFVAAATRTAAQMAEAVDDADAWHAAAMRLKGMAASFGAVRLMVLADEARPGDARALRAIRRAIDRL
jgi:HPt (histidine-containing phosphotransfer) domain-containing protein